jgi:capsular exopolysaccharide synthesis family protein
MIATDAGTAAAEAPGLVRAISVLRERWYVVVISVVVCVAVSVALTLRATKQYTATAKLNFDQQNSLVPQVGGAAPATPADPQAEQSTNLLLVTTGTVASAVKSQLNSPLSISQLLDKVSASTDQSSNVVDVSATDADPATAAAIANAFAQQFVTTSRRQNIEQVLAGERLINDQINALPATPANAAARANLRAALQKLVVLEAVQTGDAELIDQALPPTSPSSPNAKVNVLVAFVFGLGLGVGLAFLLNLLDRRLKDAEQIEAVYGTRAVATIPSGSSGTFDPAAIEQFRILRNGLSLLTPGREARVVMVTSAVPGEGKTTVATGLARAAAASGQTVILVEADFKRPAFAARLGLGDNYVGLANALLEPVDPDSLLRAPVQGLPNLLVLTSGPEPPNSAVVLRSPAMGHLLDHFAAHADLVVVDAPPMVPVADGQALLDVAQLDAYILVSRVNFTKRDEARRAHQLMERRNLSRVGLVVNGVRQLTGGGYYSSRDTMVVAE